MSSERKMAPRRFGACQGSGAGFRRIQQSVNGLLTGLWPGMSRAVAAWKGASLLWVTRATLR